MTVVPIAAGRAPADARPYADPKHPGNRIRHKVECIGCGRRGCITYWGPWCFECNVRRMDRINAAFEPVSKALGMEP